MDCSRNSIDSDQYLRRRKELRNSMRFLDQAARSTSAPAKLEATTKSIAALLGVEMDVASPIPKTSWQRCLEAELRLPIETLPITNAKAIIVKFITQSSSEATSQSTLPTVDFPKILWAVEFLTHVAFTQNERCKPSHLRQATRRFYLTSITSAAGILGLVFGIWMTYLWLTPDGVKITYFNGINFDHPAAHRVGNKLSKDYGTGRPAWGVHRNGWSARWEGFLIAPSDDDYSFYIQSMDGARLFIDDQCLVNNWHEQDWQSSGRHANMRLNKGPHHFILEHYTAGGPAAIRVRWMGGGIPADSVIEKPFLRKQ